MRLTKNGFVLENKDWSAANPRPNHESDQSGIEVYSQNSPMIFVSEDFLQHAVVLLAFDAKNRGGIDTVNRMREIGEQLIKICGDKVNDQSSS